MYQARGGRGGRGRGTRCGRNKGRSSFPKSREVDIEEQLKRNMMEWGVNRNQNSRHRAFWDENMALVKDIRRAKVERQAANILERLPADPIEAVRYVMSQEFGGNVNQNKDGLLVITDRLKDTYPGVPANLPPFAFDRDRRNYCLRNIYEDMEVEVDDVDPLKRFHSSREPVSGAAAAVL
jgi:hypothetical protein